MTTPEDRARAIRAQSHERLHEIIDEAKTEVCRIQTLDEVLGEETLKEALPGPFRESLNAAKVSTLAFPLSVSTPTPDPVRKPKKPAKKKAPRRPMPGRCPTIPAMIKDVLESVSGQWLTLKDIRLHMDQAGYPRPHKNSLRTALRNLSRAITPWLKLKNEGRLVWYSHAQPGNTTG